jgi:transposase
MAKYSVSKIKRFVGQSNSEQVTVGVDVHKQTYSVAVLRPDGLFTSWTTTADVKDLVKQLRSWEVKIKCVAYEAGPTGFGLARALSEAGIKVIVAAPSRILRPVTPGAKTDRLDCIDLAKFAQKGMLKPIAIPSEDQEAKRSLGRRRNQISKEVVRCKQRIKSLLLYHGIKEPAGLSSWSNSGLAALRALGLPTALRHTLDSHLSDLEHHLSSRKLVDKQLQELFDEEKTDRQAMACMQSIPGVGFVTASQFRLEIFDPKRFSRQEEVSALIGLAPLVRRSGKQKGSARIPQAGKKQLRSILVEAAWRLRAKEAWARRFYDKVLSRTGLPQKAIVALARKLCIVLWRICVELRPYRPAVAG